jgi:hypothetical protein
LKQRIAARAFLYYASHVEQNGPLSSRLGTFLKTAGESGFENS